MTNKINSSRLACCIWPLGCNLPVSGLDSEIKVYHHHHCTTPTLKVDLLLVVDVSPIGICQLRCVAFTVPQSYVSSANLFVSPVGGFCVSAALVTFLER